MKALQTFTIVPTLPNKIKDLKKLAYNLWWSWDHEAIDLFRRLDYDLWEETYHNPVKMLGTIKQETLEKRAKDDAFLAQLERVNQRFLTYINRKTWFQKNYPKNEKLSIAYFSAEFGLTECMPIYSGGLGILAGDHIKSAAELGLPFIGVGLLYQVGYFGQYLNADGWQNEVYPVNDFYNMPIKLIKNEDDTPKTIDITYLGRKIYALIWKTEIGNVSLYLLDTNTSLNTPEDRQITGQLYGGDNEVRIQQEILLGIGGVRALNSLKIHPNVYHMNEGHSAFLALERIREHIKKHNLRFDEAKEATSSSNVFTTHTPVPEGIDRFSNDLMLKYLGDFCGELGISWDDFMALGRHNASDKDESFSMAVLAIKLSSHYNGVSKLHGEVSRKMWGDLWPNIPANEVPIGSVTNGIHPRTWISNEMAQLYDRYLGPSWVEKPEDVTIWERVIKIPNEELWRTHERRRERLVAFARRSLQTQLKKRGAPPSEIERAASVLDPETLTIGFARRFAPYKRATLLLKDAERLAKILTNKERPVQFIFAGKAHPKNDPGKLLLKEIIQFAKKEDIRNHVVFIENYDMSIARYLVEGVDIWLNTPRRPNEASGTSGMKVAVNGGINFSILDGWWDEAYQVANGWAIGSGEEYDDNIYQDRVEANDIYEKLEKEIVPLYYDVGSDGIPHKWIEKMKSSISSVCSFFNTNRMVAEYCMKYYFPAAKTEDQLSKENFKNAKELCRWKKYINDNWESVNIEAIETDKSGEVGVGQDINIKAKINLGNLTPDDVLIQVYLGEVNSDGEIFDGLACELSDVKKENKHVYYFSGKIKCKSSGLYGYTIRILPKHQNLVYPCEMGLISWAELP